MLKKILVLIIFLFLSIKCFADEGVRMLGEGKYEYQRRNGSVHTIHVGKYSKVKEPIQNPVIYCPGACPYIYREKYKKAGH